MAKLEVVEKATGTVATILDVHLAGMNYDVDRREWEDAAWKAAVEDGSVDAAKREDYEIRGVPV